MVLSVWGSAAGSGAWRRGAYLATRPVKRKETLGRDVEALLLPPRQVAGPVSARIG